MDACPSLVIPFAIAQGMVRVAHDDAGAAIFDAARSRSHMINVT